MRSRGGANWYDFLIFGRAAAIVYPDHVLDWLSARTGKAFGLRHLVYLEVTAIGLMSIAMKLLMPVYPKLLWWYPLPFVGLLGLFRVIMRFLVGMFGFDD